jgi:hypothetical protein
MRMSLRWENVCVDSNDPETIASFWEEALGWRRAGSTPDEVTLKSPEGLEMLFLRVPESKTVKNRLHLDFRPDDQAAEVARLEKLGARRVSVGQGPDVTWVVMADPDGNEFCVLRAL